MWAPLIKCRLLEGTPHDLGIEPQPGDMWWLDMGGGVKALVLRLPGHPHNAWYSDDQWWTWTGEPPNITVSPSLHIPGEWHGWVRDGVLVSI